ncbi:hypothetical protein HWC34_gp51 [Microbacterium phage Alex44]|uniref:Acb2/Tad1 hairpin domain-containing protein n=2 Tax=Tinytimothyvirus alex44 TaxID=2845588 RepID=A0A4Y6EBM7_9CAUD|nr:hypothetical protein HWC34_gp51 [Microbacterium phage Alex44]QDF15961.1 hypothetical protein SEA_ALEX44_51 [Microbacterium phage Alex44]QDF16080.1 hypothetical protein SEA_LILYLOU_52 [Microbacterium phage LilyLou]WNM73261.1 hypothetical protein SEA_DUMPQUIST_50 [Microbacterium phage DumpQuist]
MALGQGLRENDHDMDKRFGIAQDTPASEEQLEFQKEYRLAIANVAKLLNHEVQDGREKSLAFTHLEEALMWGGKAIFAS